LRITQSDLIDRRTREQRFIHVPVEGLEERGIVVNAAEMLGRVLKDDKPAGEVFLREELAPLGTPQGLAGALPEGRRSFSLDAAKLEGASLLRRGDHIDIMASIALQLPKSVQSFQAISGKTQIKVIVNDAVVLAPVGAPETQTPTAAGEVQRELILGVQPEEVPLLAQALSLNAGLRAVFRSRQSTEPITTDETRRASQRRSMTLVSQVDNSDRIPDLSTIPSLDPMAEATLLVTQVGQDRKTWVFFPDDGNPFGGLVPLEAGSVQPNATATTSHAAAKGNSVPGSRHFVAKPSLDGKRKE
jgi:Flp pilus assembly protein CpaB